jgi:Asp-tRNA(Asn)/Glu-tRNA(Gln) amidotransferase A subunit family amidase
VRAAFRDASLDVLATPTLPRTSMPLAEMDTAVDVPRFIPYTFPWNLTGQPAISVPCGLTSSDLPAGLQLVGRPFDEVTVLRIARAYERATPWHELRPSLDRQPASR